MSKTADTSSPPPVESSTSEERRKLENLYAATKELERRTQEAPLLFYHLLLQRHEKQRRFHDALALRQKRYRVFCGGNRSGKTTAGRYEALAHAYGYRFFDVPDLRLGLDGDLPSRESISPKYWVRRSDGIPVRCPNVGMVVSGLPRLRGVGENLHPGLIAALPAATRKKTKVLRGAQGVPDWLELPNGSRILYATEEQDDMTFEGFTIDWAWIDEPVRQGLFNALLARLFDYRGSMWFTLTPLGARFAWMYETYMGPEGAASNAEVVEVFMEDNPGVSRLEVEEFKSNPNFGDREKAARLYGKPECLGDRVFEAFDPRVHVVKSFMPPKDWVHGLTADPHHKRPTFLLWWAYEPGSRTYHFYREWPNTAFHKQRDGALLPAELATVIRSAEVQTPARYRLCDPRFGPAEHIRHGYKETSFVAVMQQYGLYFDANVPNTGRIEYGHEIINDLLRYDKNFPVTPSNRPRILIHETCQNVIRGMMNYGYLDVKDPIKGLYKKVSEEFKDSVDTVRYTVLYPLPLTDAEATKLQRVTEADLREYNSDY